MERKNFYLRFYIHTSKKDFNKSYPLKLHIRVWLPITRKYLFVTTEMLVSPIQWEAFTTQGDYSSKADKAIVAELEYYKDAANMVLTELTKTPNNPDLNSVYISRRINGIAARIKSNREAKNKPQPVSFRISPYEVHCCHGCIYATKQVCTAPWPLSAMQDCAADFANYNGICQMRKEAGNE